MHHQTTPRPVRPGPLRCFPCGTTTDETATFGLYGHTWTVCRSCAEEGTSFPERTNRRLLVGWARRDEMAATDLRRKLEAAA